MRFTLVVVLAVGGVLSLCARESQAARTLVRILDDAPLHSAPGGPPLSNGGGQVSERGTFWVIRRSGDWLGIPTVARSGGALGWIRRLPHDQMTTTRRLVVVDLSERRVRVRLGGWLVMSAPVSIGASASPSPIAMTSVSARIAVTPSSGLSRSGYGPVVIALHLWQQHPSPGMPHGGVMAFHGGSGGWRMGTASSGGCFRMLDADVVRLARHVRAGTPVIIRA